MPKLSLVPCEHYWLECHDQAETVIAICRTCRKRGVFTHEEFTVLLNTNQAAPLPQRL